MIEPTTARRVKLKRHKFTYGVLAAGAYEDAVVLDERIHPDHRPCLELTGKLAAELVECGESLEVFLHPHAVAPRGVVVRRHNLTSHPLIARHLRAVILLQPPTQHEGSR